MIDLDARMVDLPDLELSDDEEGKDAIMVRNEDGEGLCEWRRGLLSSSHRGTPMNVGSVHRGCNTSIPILRMFRLLWVLGAFRWGLVPHE